MDSSPLGGRDDIGIRQAEPADADGMAQAHRDAIQSIGSVFYSSAEVESWEHDIAAGMYVEAMEHGETFFVAVAESSGRILGFSSDYRIEEATHGTSVYVRGVAARCGLGTHLLRRAEAHAIASGAKFIRIDASLGAVEFYVANGYREVGRGTTRLAAGGMLPCVFMTKEL